jgi:hypothetical protein
MEQSQMLFYRQAAGARVFRVVQEVGVEQQAAWNQDLIGHLVDALDLAAIAQIVQRLERKDCVYRGGNLRWPVVFVEIGVDQLDPVGVGGEALAGAL